MEFPTCGRPGSRQRWRQRYGDLVLLFSKVWELFETILFFSQKVIVWTHKSTAFRWSLQDKRQLEQDHRISMSVCVICSMAHEMPAIFHQCTWASHVTEHIAWWTNNSQHRHVSQASYTYFHPERGFWKIRTIRLRTQTSTTFALVQAACYASTHFATHTTHISIRPKNSKGTRNGID